MQADVLAKTIESYILVILILSTDKKRCRGLLVDFDVNCLKGHSNCSSLFAEYFSLLLNFRDDRRKGKDYVKGKENSNREVNFS